MVQDANQHREHFQPRAPSFWTPPDRIHMDSVPDENRFAADPQDIRRPPMAIDKALREFCNISAEFYVLIPVIDGKPHIFTAPTIPSLDISKFLNVEALGRELQRAQSATNPAYADPEFGFNLDVNRYPIDPARRWAPERRYGQTISLAGFEDDGNYKARKRPRASLMRREMESFEEESMPSTPVKRTITISDEKALWAFYEERFKTIQQTACKLIAKAWVKAVEPKKQSTHPYTGRDEKAPEWWPRPWGPNQEHRVRHKEPDHLYKRERVHLLVHILRMIVEPNNKQHANLQKLYLNVTKLEEVTNEALSSFFTDKENPSNMAKRPYLKEIFRVAKIEERYKDGQIDHLTSVHVMPNDRSGQGYISDTEDVTPGRDDIEPKLSPHSDSASPPRASVSQPLMAPSHSTEQSPTPQMPSDAFVGDMPVRNNNQYNPSILGPDITTERQTFVEAPNMQGSQPPLHPPTNIGLHDLYTNPHDSSRRSSMFTSQSEYTSPATPTMYSHWQTGSTAPNNPPVYAFQQQASNTHQPFVGHTSVAMPQAQQYMGGAFDGLARSHDTQQHPSLLRQPPPPNYPSYMPHEPGPLPGSGIKVDGLARHSTQ